MTHSIGMWRPPPPSIAHVLAHYGLADCHVRLVARLDCTVWRVATADAQDLSLRIYAPEREDTAPIATEVAWLRTLADAGVHVPRPLPTREGLYITSWQAHAGAPSQHAILLGWLRGRMLYKGLLALHLRRVGALAARLHDGAQALAGQAMPISKHSAYASDTPAWALGLAPLPRGYPPQLQRSVQHAVQQLQRLSARWPRDSAHWGLIHGDLHPWNMVFHRGEAGAIDFSDSGQGFMAHDLAGVLQFLKHPLTPCDEHHRVAYPRLRDALLEGYAALRPLPDSLLAQIEPLIASRMLTTLQWIVDDWPRPDHRAWGPGFLSGLGEVLDRAFA